MPHDAADDDDETLADALAKASFVPICAWCGRYAVEGTWRRFRPEDPFLRDLAVKKPTHTVCEECFARLRATGQSH